MPRPDASQRLAAAKPKQGPSQALIASIVAVVLVLGAITTFVIVHNSSSSTKVAVAETPVGGLPNGNGINPYPNVKLQAGAPTVDLYEDFQCPVCKELETNNDSQINAAAQSGKIKLIYHMMTFLDGNFGNTASALAANASYCAAADGKFAEYHHQNYLGQPATEGTGYTAAQVKQFGQKAGITGAALTTFNQCVDANTFAKYVAATETQSGKNGVDSTPSIFFNGKELSKSSQQYAQLLQQPNTFDSVLQSKTGK